MGNVFPILLILFLAFDLVVLHLKGEQTDGQADAFLECKYVGLFF